MNKLKFYFQSDNYIDGDNSRWKCNTCEIIHEVYQCQHCDGHVVYHKRKHYSGWGHTVATGCVSPSVDMKTWKEFLKRQNELKRLLK